MLARMRFAQYGTRYNTHARLPGMLTERLFYVKSRTKVRSDSLEESDVCACALGCITTASMKRRWEFGQQDERSRRGVQQRVRQMLVIERLCTRFPVLARQLLNRHDQRETLHVVDEYDLRDLLRTLLTLEHDDIHPETWTPDGADWPRTDFLLKIERTIVIARMTSATFGQGELQAQLPADIGHYHHHPDCETLVCFVYDPEGRIARPRELEHTLSTDTPGLTVRVFVASK